MQPFSYWTWPRTAAGKISLKSTDDALFYASKIWRNEDRVDEIDDNLDRSRDEIELLNPLTGSNIVDILDKSFEIGFFVECLEECQRLDVVYGSLAY